jgi:hypothetical protein
MTTRLRMIKVRYRSHPKAVNVYKSDDIIEATGDLLTEDGQTILTEDGQTIQLEGD